MTCENKTMRLIIFLAPDSTSDINFRFISSLSEFFFNIAGFLNDQNT